MVSYKVTKIIPAALILVVIAITIAALVSLTRVIFFSGGSNSTISQVDVAKEALLNTNSDHSVVLTVRGPIVGNEDFRSYKISITPTSREIVIYQGYQNQPIDKIALDNNSKDYEQFVFALDKANLVKGVEFTGDKNDTRGICSTGKIYDFQVLVGDKVAKQLWTSTCSGSKGSLSASANQLINLFIAQIPGSQKLISKNW